MSELASSSLIARARSSHDAPSPYYAEYAFRCDLTKHEILYHRVKWSLEKAVALGRADILERNQDIWKNVVPKENLIDLASEKGHLKVVQGDKALSPSDPLRLASANADCLCRYL